MDPAVKSILLAGGVFGACVSAYSAFWWYEGQSCEKPRHDVIKVLKPATRWLFLGSSKVEMRRYPTMLVAEVTMTGLPMKDAMGKGFMKVAKFIFGGNKARDGRKSQSIAMTAPVRMSMPEGQAQKIAMTAPVRTEISESKDSASKDSAAAGSGSNVYKISFVMPSEYTKDTLPIPDNSELEVKEVAAHTAVAISFNGPSPSPKVIERKRQELLSIMKEHGLSPKGDVMVYQYHPPFAPNFLRLNEVLYMVDDDASSKDKSSQDAPAAVGEGSVQKQPAAGGSKEDAVKTPEPGAMLT